MVHTTWSPQASSPLSRWTPSASLPRTPAPTTTGYDPIDGASNTGPTSGWILRQPTTVTTQMGTSPSSNDLVTKTRYDAAGRTVEERLPGASGADPATTLTTYYSTAANGTYPTCGLKAQWAGLVCRTDPAGAPASGPAVPSSATSYDLYGNTLTVTETSGSTTRTATNTYDAAGRPVSESSATSGLTGSTPLPTTTTGYDTGTGDQLTITQGTAVLTATYDAIGRQLTQVDADSNTTTNTYDIDGNLATVNDGKGTYTYTYATATEHRRLVTSVDTGMGALSTFSTTYDAAGHLVSRTLPNGTIAASTYDNNGTRRSLTYTLPASGGVSNTLTFTAVPDAFGKTIHAQSPGSTQDDTYDNAGRLTSVADTVAGACTTRTYDFDAQGDRTSLTTYGPGIGGACQVTTATTTITTTYDTANRIATSTGYTYDALGRATTIPASNLVTGNGNLVVGYYDTDMPNALTQGATAKAFTLDPAGRYRTATDTTNGSEARRISNHYASSAGDSPSWIDTSTDAGVTWSWQRYVQGIEGYEALQESNGTTTLGVTNLHGDIVASVPNLTAGAGTSISAYGESTEYGALRAGSSSVDARFGWLGSEQRSSDTPAMLVLMGVRLYNPMTGQFLSRDSIANGNENAYAYPNDPVGESDLSGRCWFCYIDKASWVTRYSRSGRPMRTLVVTPSWYLRANSNVTSAYLGWNELKRKVSSANTSGMQNQFVCHVLLQAGLWRGTYNLDPSRRAVSLAATLRAGCNP